MFETIEEDIRLNFDNAKKTLLNLKKIGKIDNDFPYDIFMELLEHKNRDVRIEAIKNLGKYGGDYIEESLIQHFYTETDSLVKRECISSLGRQRNYQRVTFFTSVLQDKDPKIVLQAIRALLVFKNDEFVKNELLQIKEHPNEMIKEVIEIEFKEKRKKNIHHHSFVNPKLKNIIVNGDVIDTLKLLDEESIHLTFTSPPYYNARDYSFYSSYQEYLEFLRSVFKETHRVTKNGRFLIVNTSPVIVPRVSRKHSSKRYPIPFDIHNFLMQDGWEFIDDIIWKKPETSVKNRIGGFIQHRKPLGYKPNCTTEYIMVYRKKTHDLLDWNIKQYDKDIVERSKVHEEFETSNVWNIDPTFDKIHSAVFPKELCDRIIKYYSYVDDLVFDPFGGSGTFAESAINLNRSFFSTEINKNYFFRIKEKLSKYNINKKFFTLKEFQKWMQQEN